MNDIIERSKRLYEARKKPPDEIQFVLNNEASVHLFHGIIFGWNVGCLYHSDAFTMKGFLSYKKAKNYYDNLVKKYG